MTDKILQKLALGVALLAGVSACALDADMTPESDKESTISVSEAISRSVKFNTESRSKSLERTMAKSPQKLTKSSLPSLTASAGYPMRSSNYKEKPADIDLSISYNILDYAINYAAASDEKELEKSAQRIENRTEQNLIHETRTAFWRAAAAQKNQPDIDHLTELLRYELSEAEQVENDVDLSVVSLGYQQDLHAIMRRLMVLRKEMAASEVDFSLLANIPLEANVSLAIPEKMDKSTGFFIPELSKLENQALINRPENLIGDYNVKMNASEVRKDAAKLFPKTNLGAKLRYNPAGEYPQSWQEDIADVSLNIMNIPVSRDDSDTDLSMQRKQRTAINMGILAEVNIAYRRIKEASEAMDAASTLQAKYQKEWEEAAEKEKEGAISRPDLVKALANKVIADLKRDFAFAELKSAESALNLAAGLNFIKDIDTSASLPSINKTVVNGLLNEHGVNQGSVKKVTEKVYVAPTVKIDAEGNAPSGSRDDYWAKGNWLEGVVADEEKFIAETKIEATKAKQEARAAGTALEAEFAAKDGIASSRPSAKQKKATEALQIGSFADMESARNYWANMQIKYPVLADYQVEYRQASINSKPVNRVFVKGNKFELQSLCKKIPEAKDCILRK
ncbi:MAG: TolC family protein [Alphaproteobacteria bacterium]|nr:TolC family protein [Alphaproteobacteria bacterium]